MQKILKSSQKIKFLTVKDIKYIHRCQVELFGGLHGIRDQDLLASAVHEPKVTFDGKFLYQDIYIMAAAYVFGVIKNHPFIDGNKRTGIESAFLFLRLNNISIVFNQGEMINFAVAIATSNLKIDEIADIFHMRSEIE